jgi:hypothetical protein
MTPAQDRVVCPYCGAPVVESAMRDTVLGTRTEFFTCLECPWQDAIMFPASVYVGVRA